MPHFYGALDVLSERKVTLSLLNLDAEETVHFLKHVLNCFPRRAPCPCATTRHLIEAHPLLDLIYFPLGCPDLDPQGVSKSRRALPPSDATHLNSFARKH
jgi:hypothetical protein